LNLHPCLCWAWCRAPGRSDLASEPGRVLEGDERPRLCVRMRETKSKTGEAKMSVFGADAGEQSGGGGKARRSVLARRKWPMSASREAVSWSEKK